MRPKPKHERLAVPVKQDFAELDLFWDIVSVLVRSVSDDLRFLYGNRRLLDSFKEALAFFSRLAAQAFERLLEE
jgi:hypothetical protein